MDSPNVSICLPTYNYAAFIGRAIESVLAQTFADFELLIFDDASTDDTETVVERYLGDERVRYVRHHRNQGLFTNFNLSAQAARGRFVKYLCADDWLDARFLEATVPMLENDSALVLATTANWLVDVDGQLTGEQFGPFGDADVVDRAAVADALAEWGNVVGMPTNTLIRRDELLSVGGFDERFAPAADVHLWLKLLAHGDMGWVRRPHCFVRVHERHSHTYGPDPTEAMFLVWEDRETLGAIPVGDGVRRRAVNREARRCLLYACAHLLRFDGRKALSILQFTRRHVRMLPALARFGAGLPAIVRDQLSRIVALRTRRMVIYTPAPRCGRRLDDARMDVGVFGEVE